MKGVCPGVCPIWCQWNLTVNKWLAKCLYLDSVWVRVAICYVVRLSCDSLGRGRVFHTYFILLRSSVHKGKLSPLLPSKDFPHHSRFSCRVKSSRFVCTLIHYELGLQSAMLFSSCDSLGRGRVFHTYLKVSYFFHQACIKVSFHRCHHLKTFPTTVALAMECSAADHGFLLQDSNPLNLGAKFLKKKFMDDRGLPPNLIGQLNGPRTFLFIVHFKLMQSRRNNREFF